MNPVALGRGITVGAFGFAGKFCTGVRGALVLLGLALAAVSIAATESAPNEALEPAQSVAGKAAHREDAEAAASAPDDPPQRAEEGFFSSIIRFFRREAPERPTEAEPNEDLRETPEGEQARAGAPASDGAPEAPRTQGPEEEPLAEPERIEERNTPAGHEENRKQKPQAAPSGEGDGAELSANHVYRATLDLLAEIAAIREARDIADLPAEPEVQDHQSSLGAYIKAREVMEKTARVQRRFGMLPVHVAPVPVTEIGPNDMLRSIQAIMEELRRVKRQLVIRKEIRAAPIAEGKTLAEAYKNLEYASLLLDGLVGRPTTLSDLYMHLLHVREEMELIAAHLGVVIDTDPSAVKENREPREIVEQVLRAIYRTVSLQSRLGMQGSSVPSTEHLQVTPADVLDATNLLLEEVMRIKVHMDIQSLPEKREPAQKKQSSDTFSEVRLVLEIIKAITKTTIDTQ